MQESINVDIDQEKLRVLDQKQKELKSRKRMRAKSSLRARIEEAPTNEKSSKQDLSASHATSETPPQVCQGKA